MRKGGSRWCEQDTKRSPASAIMSNSTEAIDETESGTLNMAESEAADGQF